jgi:molybdenum-dependent DNA-binding transcriptional regulator ModE
MEDALGSPVVEKERGGRTGGGTRLTPLGESILEQYNLVEEYLKKICKVMDEIENCEVKGVIRKIKTDESSAILEVETPTTQDFKESDEIIIIKRE